MIDSPAGYAGAPVPHRRRNRAAALVCGTYAGASPGIAQLADIVDTLAEQGAT